MVNVQFMHTFILTPSKAMYSMYTFLLKSRFVKNKIYIVNRFLNRTYC